MAPGLNPNPAVSNALLPKFSIGLKSHRLCLSKSPTGLVKVTDWSCESHLPGLYDKCVCVLLHTSGYRSYWQGDDEHRRAKHGADKISRSNDEHVAHDVSRIIPGRMTGVDAAQADHGYTHNCQ